MAFLKEKLELELEEAELKAREAVSRFPRWAIIIVIFCVLGSMPAYYLTRSLAYSSNLKKFSTLLVTARPSFTAPKNLATGTPVITTIGNGIYAAAFPVTNENLDLGLSGISYEVRAYNKSHSLVAKSREVFFILPNQSKWAAAPRLVSPDPVASVEISFPEPLPWKRNLNIPTAQLNTTNPKTYNQTSPVAFVVEGTVENRSPYQIGKTTLVFILKDKTGKIIGISQRLEQTLTPFERRTYQQIWPNVYTNDVEKTEVYAYTDTFDPDNITAAPVQTPSTKPNSPGDSRQ